MLGKCRVSAAVALGALLAAAPVAAHPLGNFSVNRYAAIRVEPEAVEVRYLVDMAEIPTFQEMQEWGVSAQADHPETMAYLVRQGRCPRPRAPHAHRWAAARAPCPVAAGALRAGRRSTMTIAIVYRAPIEGAGARALSYRDENFADRIGWREVVARAAPGVVLAASGVPFGSEPRAQRLSGRSVEQSARGLCGGHRLRAGPAPGRGVYQNGVSDHGRGWSRRERRRGPARPPHGTPHQPVLRVRRPEGGESDSLFALRTAPVPEPPVVAIAPRGESLADTPSGPGPALAAGLSRRLAQRPHRAHDPARHGPRAPPVHVGHGHGAGRVPRTRARPWQDRRRRLSRRSRGAPRGTPSSSDSPSRSRIRPGSSCWAR